MESLPNRYSVL